MIEHSAPVIPERPVEIPRHHKPFLRPAAIEEQKMVFVERIPVLHKRCRGQVVYVLFQVHAFVKELRHVARLRQVVTEPLQLVNAVGLFGFHLIMAAERSLASQISLIRLIGP